MSVRLLTRSVTNSNVKAQLCIRIAPGCLQLPGDLSILSHFLCPFESSTSPQFPSFPVGLHDINQELLDRHFPDIPPE